MVMTQPLYRYENGIAYCPDCDSPMVEEIHRFKPQPMFKESKYKISKPRHVWYCKKCDKHLAVLQRLVVVDVRL